MENYFYHYTEENKAIKVKIGYEKGGMNYLSGQVANRGIYIYFTCVEIQDRGSYKMESFTVFGEGNYKILLKETKRENKKDLEKMYIILQNNKEKLIELYPSKDIEAIKNIFIL